MTARTFGSVFSGVGGFDRALERAGWRCAFQVENDPACNRVLARHWPDVPRYGDIREVAGATLPPIDLLVGGWPCQDHSVAGRRGGLDGERSGLFHHFARLVAECRPRFLLAENVPGLLSQPESFRAVLRTLDELGYVGGWRVLDARYFGVPQRRRRVFLVAGLGADGARAAAVLFDPESGGGHPAPSREARARTAASLTAGAHRAGVNEPGRHAEGDVNLVVAHALSAHGRARHDPNGEDWVVGYGVSENQRAECRLTDIARQLTTGGGKPGQGYPAVLAFHQIQDPISGPVSPALGGKSSGMGAQQGPVVRRLTPVECHRLMGLPDDWCAGETDSAQYRMLGNSVVGSVVEWIGRRLLEAQ